MYTDYLNHVHSFMGDRGRVFGNDTLYMYLSVRGGHMAIPPGVPFGDFTYPIYLLLRLHNTI